MFTKELCVIGGGAVGSILTYYLYRGGLSDITVFYRTSESVKAVNEAGGLTVVYDGKEEFIPVEAGFLKDFNARCLYVINAVKAYDVADTLPHVPRIVDEGSLVLMVQNGFGSYELVLETYPHLNVACGVVFIGATRIGLNKVAHNGGETVFAGSRFQALSKLLELSTHFRRGGCDFRVVEDIEQYRWVKLALNAVVNPLTAISRCRNKVVLLREGVELAGLIVREVVEAAEKHGYSLDYERLLKMVFRAVESVSENYSSMLQDVASGRSTEVDYINGFVAEKLGYRGVNHILTLLVKMIEESVSIGC